MRIETCIHLPGPNYFVLCALRDTSYLACRLSVANYSLLNKFTDKKVTLATRHHNSRLPKYYSHFHSSSLAVSSLKCNVKEVNYLKQTKHFYYVTIMGTSTGNSSKEGITRSLTNTSPALVYSVQKWLSSFQVFGDCEQKATFSIQLNCARALQTMRYFILQWIT